MTEEESMQKINAVLAEVNESGFVVLLSVVRDHGGTHEEVVQDRLHVVCRME